MFYSSENLWFTRFLTTGDSFDLSGTLISSAFGLSTIPFEAVLFRDNFLDLATPYRSVDSTSTSEEKLFVSD
jgi:hypothetical protein